MSFVTVAGVEVPATLADEAPQRPRLVLVTRRWGANWGERNAAVRSFVGAAALRAEVSVVSLEDPPPAGRVPLRYDGLFPVHSVPVGADLSSGEPSELADALQTALGLRPQVVVLAGGGALPLGGMLWDAFAPSERPRIVALPLGDIEHSGAASALGRYLDAIVAFSEAERALLDELLDPSSPACVRRLRIDLPVNRAAASAGLAGMTSFGRFVLVISAFPDDDPGTGTCPPHEYLRQVLGGISIAEACRHRWLVTGGDREHRVVWAPNRMNLWRLMARAEVTLDVRPPGPIGREAIESLRFGTPVVVPAGGAAAEAAAEAGGGLWYRDTGEMVDAVRRLIEDAAMREAMGTAGRAWSERWHGDGGAFVGEVLELALGEALPPQP
ncbi:MAG: glycosyltransferase [Acidimicrobiales bacterium]